MQSCARTLADRVEAGHRSPSPKIGPDSAHVIVGGGRDGDRCRADVDAEAGARGGDVRKSCADVLRRSDRPRVEPHEARRDRAAIAGRSRARRRRAAQASPRGSASKQKRLPAESIKIAPSPRAASDTRCAGAPGSASAVGWNWTNSMSASIAPALSASSSPSAVAPWRIRRAREHAAAAAGRKRGHRREHSATRRSYTCSQAPRQPRSSTMSSTAVARSRTLTFGWRIARAAKACR